MIEFLQKLHFCDECICLLGWHVLFFQYFYRANFIWFSTNRFVHASITPLSDFLSYLIVVIDRGFVDLNKLIKSDFDWLVQILCGFDNEIRKNMGCFYYRFFLKRVLASLTMAKKFLWRVCAVLGGACFIINLFRANWCLRGHCLDFGELLQ